eukprot:gene2290-2635_t
METPHNHNNYTRFLAVTSDNRTVAIKAYSAAMEQKWKNFEQKVKAKREINVNRKKKEPAEKVKVEQLTIQRLSASVSGKAQKFSRIGPREFVPYPHGDLTLEGIKKSCEAHFAPRLNRRVSCDVLAGEQGPSCNNLEQVPNLKLIHVRLLDNSFDQSRRYNTKIVESEKNFLEDLDSGISSFIPTKKRRGESEERSKIDASSVQVPVCKVPKVFPKSLSITQMMNLGKEVKQTTTKINMYKFNLETMTWSSLTEAVEFLIDEKPFANGGFREVFKATSATEGYENVTWVVKKYLQTDHHLSAMLDNKQNLEN